MATYEREKTVGQGMSSVDCYMKDYNVTKEETIIRFNRWIEHNWRHVNQALLKPTVVSSVVLESTVYNTCCTVDLMYNFANNGFTTCANLKEFIKLLYVEPVSM